MALTRRLLEGLGIEGKHVETIIEAHAETVNALKAERDGYKERAEMVPDLQRQLEEAKGSTELADLQAKYDEQADALAKGAEELKKANAAIKEANEAKKQLEEQLKEAQDEGESLRNGQAELGDKLAALEQERDGLRNEYDAYKADVEGRETMRNKAKAYRKQVLERAGVAAPYLDDLMGVTKLDGVELDDDGNITDADERVERAREKWASFILKTKTETPKVETPPESEGGPEVEGAHPRALQIARERHERLYGKSEE